MRAQDFCFFPAEEGPGSGLTCPLAPISEAFFVGLICISCWAVRIQWSRACTTSSKRRCQCRSCSWRASSMAFDVDAESTSLCSALFSERSCFNCSDSSVVVLELASEGVVESACMRFCAARCMNIHVWGVQCMGCYLPASVLPRHPPSTSVLPRTVEEPQSVDLLALGCPAPREAEPLRVALVSSHQSR